MKRLIKQWGDTMLRKIFPIFSLFIIPAVLLMTPLAAHSDPADPEEVAHMKSGHQKVEGVVSEVKSGLYTVKTPTGATLTLTEAAAVRHGHSAPKVGDEMTLWVNEGNMVMDARPKGQPGKAPRFITGTLASIDNGTSQMTLSTSGGERGFRLRPESRMFRDIAVGTEVTIEVNDREEVIDIHKDKK
ncbi:MAG TPA: hypothetical protein VK901_09505 [Nitrospiraceae bacterium]|nr:hypothetical protein [Nitrospiraceae bacterium]